MAKPTPSTAMEKSFCAFLFYQALQFRRPRLPFLHLLRRETLFENGNQFAGFFVSICFCQEKSSVFFNEILRHAFAVVIQDAKEVLRYGVSLLGFYFRRLEKPDFFAFRLVCHFC